MGSCRKPTAALLVGDSLFTVVNMLRWRPNVNCSTVPMVQVELPWEVPHVTDLGRLPVKVVELEGLPAVIYCILRRPLTVVVRSCESPGECQ